MKDELTGTSRIAPWSPLPQMDQNSDSMLDQTRVHPTGLNVSEHILYSRQKDERELDLLRMQPEPD